MRIAIVGEAWGREEREAGGQPFVGSAGKILNSMLRQVGIDRHECLVTNVFNLQPEPTNDITNLCGPKVDAIAGYPAIQAGKYIRAQYESELVRLFAEIKAFEPTLIIALGASAAWALLGTSGIKKVRGAPSLLSGRALLSVGRAIKVLPTYHPAAVMREWTLRPICIADLEKAKAEAAFPELRRPKREIWIEPNLSDLHRFGRDFIIQSPDLSVDIETVRDQITCIGFAPSTDRAIVVPFINPLSPDGNYWRTLEEELVAWTFVRKWCRLTKRVHVGQNYMYDMHFLWRRYGIAPRQTDDTMLMHHSKQPEMEKGLGFMATIYTEELAWKFMRAKHDTVKQED